jgi:Zn-dependent M28 family amino/carboxypeptidase
MTRALALLALAVTLSVGWTQQEKVTSSVIDATRLLRDLQALSADDMEGRQVGTPGGAKARAYVIRRFIDSGLTPFGKSFEQPFTFTGRGGEVKGVNVIGHIAGATNLRPYIVITAHYDHVGVRNGQVFNGADDNASGTAALFALAAYFNINRPQHPLIFVAFDGEESGLRGANAFVAAPPVDVGALAINLNMDMIGRDPNNLLFAVGTRQQPYLKPFIERIAAKAPVKLVMGHDDPAQKENWTGQSDHAAFCRAKIPCLYFGVEDFDQHHRATDDYETMTHAFYVRAVETMVLAVREFDANLDAVMKGRSSGRVAFQREEPRLR